MGRNWILRGKKWGSKNSKKLLWKDYRILERNFVEKKLRKNFGPKKAGRDFFWKLKIRKKINQVKVEGVIGGVNGIDEIYWKEWIGRVGVIVG